MEPEVYFEQTAKLRLTEETPAEEIKEELKEENV